MATAVGLALAGFSIFVLLSPPQQVETVLVFSKPPVNVDVSVLDTDQFKNLQSFTPMEKQYAYSAKDKDNIQLAGSISAESEELARKMLEDKGWTVLELKEVKIGRDNPFIPYQAVKTTKTTPTKK